MTTVRPSLQQFWEAGKKILYGEVELLSFSTIGDQDKYYFRVGGTDCSLVITRVDKKSIYRRSWYCTCIHTVTNGYTHNLSCQHVRAAEYWLIREITYNQNELIKLLRGKKIVTNK